MGPPSSNRVTRVRSYSGATLVCAAFRLQGFHLLRPAFPEPFGYTSHVRIGGPQPRRINPPVWPLSRSLAATWEIDVSFFSYRYLDVSVPRVPFVLLCIHSTIHTHCRMWVPPFGYLRVYGYVLLTAAFRSLSRPSSAPSAKASP